VKFYQQAASCEAIHNDISLIWFVIPGLTRNPGPLWVPAFAGMTFVDGTSVVAYNKV